MIETHTKLHKTDTHTHTHTHGRTLKKKKKTFLKIEKSACHKKESDSIIMIQRIVTKLDAWELFVN